MDRKLAAILAADVVGYSAHMHRDEAGTFARLKAEREQLFEPEIARHHGRIFKVMGDGMLAEFGSVVDAVECAVALQRGLAARNADVAELQRIHVRIGINLGEVIVDGDDRYGEGVNIATRLEQLAEPGGIWVSGKVAVEVEKKLAFGFEPMGDQRVKNIAAPVSAFRVNLDGGPARRIAPRARALRSWKWAALAAAVMFAAGLAWALPRFGDFGVTPSVADARPSLVVLPFANLSDDEEQGYLADGITDDLTTELARVPGLFVVSRNAAFAYKGKAAPPGEIGQALGVRYILEGSTRRAVDDMRINAQLIDADTSGHIWAERFDGRWADVFALQNSVVQSVAGALKLRLVQVPEQDSVAGGTSNPEAYDLHLRGLELQLRGEPQDAPRMVKYYEDALALDPDFGAPAADLAWVYWHAVDESVKAMGLSWEENDAKIYESLERAAKNPSPSYYHIRAQLLTRQRRSDEAIEGLQKAVAMDPSNEWTFEGLSQALTFNGRPQEGRANLDASLRLDPGWNDHRRYLAGIAAFGEGRFEDAAVFFEEIALEGASPWPRWYGLQALISALRSSRTERGCRRGQNEVHGRPGRARRGALHDAARPELLRLQE